MKKILLLSVGILYSTLVWGQNVPQSADTARITSDPEFEKEFFSMLDMEIFHDKFLVQNMMLALYNQDNPEDQLDIQPGVFDEKDSNILENAIKAQKIDYNITPELLEKTNEDPFEAMKDFIRSSSILKISREEMETLNQLDKKAIPRTLQMVTESGPDIGSKSVLVIYNEM